MTEGGEIQLSNLLQFVTMLHICIFLLDFFKVGLTKALKIAVLLSFVSINDNFRQD